MHSVLLPIALMIAAAKLGGEACERLLKQPAVLAEILAGIFLGKSVLGWVHGEDAALHQIAEIGAVLLLFEVGLESELDELFRVGREALFVALLGVALPFALGYWLAGVMGQPSLARVFIAATLTATSVGITARVFTDLNLLQCREARIVLAAAVADDILGLIILATVNGLAASGHVSVVSAVQTAGIAIAFLVGAVYLGLKATPTLLKWAGRMNTRAAVSSTAVVFCLLLSAFAETAQLAPIVGAFAAGLVLAKTENKVRFESNVHSIADLFIPIFFVLMGAQTDLRAVDGHVLALAGGMIVVAIVGKVAAGALLPVKGVARWVIGIGMVPRGEVGLIFAGIGMSKGVFDAGIYAALILVVLGTTFLTPPALKIAARKCVPAA